MKRVYRIMLLFFVCFFTLNSVSSANDGVIKIGFNIPLTGWLQQPGNRAKNAAKLILDDLQAQEGLKVGNKTYDVVFLFGDNRSNPSDASSLAIQQISNGKVLGLVGPLSSQHAVPVGQLVNAFSTPMIASWSTSPATTKDRPYVFRSGTLYTLHGPVITKFAANEFKAKKAAVLFDIVSAYPRGMASNFKIAFETKNGPGSVVAFEEFRTGDHDFRPQLRRIMVSGAQFLFTPQHYNEVPLILQQAKEIGLTIPIMGSSSWAGGDLIGGCGDNCEGLFYTGDYAPGGAKGINRQFVDAYNKAYGTNPDEPAALTWDATHAMLQAIKNVGHLSGNLKKDRTAVMESLTGLKNFEGATGIMNFNATGNPKDCVVIVRIVNKIRTFYDSVCP